LSFDLLLTPLAELLLLSLRYQLFLHNLGREKKASLAITALFNINPKLLALLID
jgi:hypothetical protein